MGGRAPCAIGRAPKGQQIMRLLHIPPDPRAPDPENEAWWKYTATRDRGTALDAFSSLVEPLVLRGLAPQEWLERENVERLSDIRGSITPILHNPRALIDAEALLREGLAGTCGRYVGLWSWNKLCSTAYAGENGTYVPSAREFGLERAKRVNLSRDWIDATRDTGSSWGGGGEHAWSCATQILGGPAWIADLYRTGLGLWCVRETLDAPEWVLIVRPGNGLPWPKAAEETQTTPGKTGAEVTT